MPSPRTVLDISKSSVIAVVLGNLTVGSCCMLFQILFHETLNLEIVLEYFTSEWKFECFSFDEFVDTHRCRDLPSMKIK